MRELGRASGIAVLALLISAATADAGSEWVKWGHDLPRRNWERIDGWPTAKACDANLPRFADGLDLMTNRVPGWCCLPDRINPHEAEGRDTALVWAYCDY